MRIGVITARDADYHPNRRFLEAGNALGLQVSLLHPFKLWSGLTAGGPLAAGAADLGGLSVVLPRVGATISDYTLTLLRQLELMGLPLLNGSRAIAVCRHKYYSLQVLSAAGLPVLETYLVNSLPGYADAKKRLGGPPLVIKLVSGRQGSGVFLVNDDDPDPLVDGRRLGQVMEQRQGVLAQRFLPPQGRRDVRVLLMGGEAAGAMEITPAPGEFRANVHLGGQGRVLSAKGRLLELAKKAGEAVGLEVAGVDLMQDAGGAWWLGEVNFTPGFQGLEQATGQDIATRILEFALTKAASA
ncbi:hypothetical protein AAU61_17625 [Desulfocarbo indianensis]|nr:hypothetical protein AAU61_17625 [Desulfocarbo indianensis]